MNNENSTVKKELVELIETLTESQALYSLTFLSLMFKNEE